MRHLRLLLSVLVVVSATRLAHAGAPLSPEETLRSTADTVIVATVLEVAQHGATNGHPPRVTLQVNEVLRGRGVDKQLQGVWSPDGQMAFYAQREGGEAGLKRWQQTPLGGPEKGSRWILEGRMEKGAFVVWFRPRWPYSDSMREKAVELIRKGPRS